MTATPPAAPAAALPPITEPWAAWRPLLDDVFLTLTGRAAGPDIGAAALAGVTGKDAA